VLHSQNLLVYYCQCIPINRLLNCCYPLIADNIGAKIELPLVHWYILAAIPVIVLLLDNAGDSKPICFLGSCKLVVWSNFGFLLNSSVLTDLLQFNQASLVMVVGILPSLHPLTWCHSKLYGHQYTPYWQAKISSTWGLFGSISQRFDLQPLFELIPHHIPVDILG